MAPMFRLAVAFTRGSCTARDVYALLLDECDTPGPGHALATGYAVHPDSTELISVTDVLWTTTKTCDGP